MKPFVNDLRFSESGVRGIVGAGLTPRLVTVLAGSFGALIGRKGKVVLGRDTRCSGPALEDAVTAGLLGAGCEVVQLGIVPTPTVQLMVEELGAAGGIAITASHNPEPFNALKFIGPDGCFLGPNASAQLFDIFSQEQEICVPESALRGVTKQEDPFAVHMKKIFSSGIDVEAIKKRHLRVAVDCINGVGALFSRRFLEALGCTVFTLNDTPDGHFARRPEPVPEVLGALCELVKKEHCDIGFAQDPDGDRLTLVTERGDALSQHMTVALAIEHIMSDSEAAAAVNIQTTRAVTDIVKSYGGELFYSRVGEINVVECMRRNGCIIGGEGNCGGVIYGKVHYGRDSFVAMALLLEMLVTDNASLSKLASLAPCWFPEDTRFNASAMEARMVIERLAADETVGAVNRLDGLRIDFDDGWVLIRSSNTESILRLSAEATSETRAQELLALFRSRIETILGRKGE